MAKKKVSLTQFAVAVAGRHPVKPILAADIVAFIVRIGGYLAIGMHVILLAAPKSAALLQVREAVSARRGDCCSRFMQSHSRTEHISPFEMTTVYYCFLILQILRVLTVFCWLRADVMWGAAGWTALLSISLLFGFTTAFVNLGALSETGASRYVLPVSGCFR